MLANNIVHVVVAVIQNEHGQYLIAKRPDNTHQGGLWEFPGGKVESNETSLAALSRELQEEVGIDFSDATPLIQVHHDYGDKSVLLDVFRVTDISGVAFGKEGQEICWVGADKLNQYEFPQANIPILKAIQLPDKYMLTGAFVNESELLTKIRTALQNDIKLIQFRAHHLSEQVYFDYAKKIYSLCQRQGAKLLLNTSLDKFNEYKSKAFSDGLHLTSKEIKHFSSKNINSGLLVSTSVHNKEELVFAEKSGVDFAVLSPVNKTSTHPDAFPLGWEKFKQLTQEAAMPLYALGGMKKSDLSIAIANGAQGIAAISVFWD